jgi:hypothetical protein
MTEPDPSTLTPQQLTALREIRRRRRELTRQAARELSENLRIVNAAVSRRSQQRHRFMLLAGGIVGITGPLLLREPRLVDHNLVRIGSALLLADLIVGAVFDAIDHRRTTPLLVAVGRSIRASSALAIAQDSKLISLARGERDISDLDTTIAQAERDAERADGEVRRAGESFSNVSILEQVLFFGLFVVGVLLMVGAAGRVGG